VIRRSSERVSDPRQREAGFTLVELIIAVVIVATISAALVTVLGTSVRVSGSTTQKVRESNDAALISSFLVRDAQAAGGTDPVTAALDLTLGVSTSDAASCGTPLAAGSNVVVRFKWNDRQWNTATQTSTARSMVATYVLDGAGTLTRYSCAGGGATSIAVLGRHVASAVATCDPSCSGLPTSVSLTVDEAADVANPTSPYSYRLQALIRPQQQPAPSSSNGTTVPLMTLGGGVCTSVSGSGNGTIIVNGDVIVNSASGSGACPAVDLAGNAGLTPFNGSLQILSPGTCHASGNNTSCPPYSN